MNLRSDLKVPPLALASGVIVFWGEDFFIGVCDDCVEKCA
jgi:hypothetical protein